LVELILKKSDIKFASHKPNIKKKKKKRKKGKGREGEGGKNRIRVAVTHICPVLHRSK
jgi:hypothetical protein